MSHWVVFLSVVVLSGCGTDAPGTAGTAGSPAGGAGAANAGVGAAGSIAGSTAEGGTSSQPGSAGSEQSDAGEAGSSGAVNEPDLPTIKVMSFNLRYGTAADGDNSWALRKPLTFDVFTRQQADLIGTQEGQSAQLSDIDAAVSGY